MAKPVMLAGETAKVRNAEKFRSDLAVLNDAAVGVVMVRSREPFRAIDSIKSLAFAKKLPLKLWTVVKGWEEFPANGSTPTAGDGKKDPNMALQAIGGLADNSGGMGDGFYVMMYPHHWLKAGQAIPAVIQSLKEYCRQFAHQPTTRLVLVAPQGFSLPSELEEDIAILDFDVPSYSELMTQLDTALADMPQAKRPSLTAEDKDRLVSAGAGMQLSEFDTAFARATVTHRAKLPGVPVDELVAEVMKVKTEVVKRSEVLEIMPVANMDNVGGADLLKEWLAKRALTFGPEAKAFGIEPPKGIGLFGPPGTGKSLFGKATAHGLGKPLIKFNVDRVFAGLVGESEARVRAALKMIDAMAPCVVLVDEVDKAFQRSSGGDSGVSQRVLGAVLTHMQESNNGVFWIVTGNRVENLPSELLRRGRLDEVFSVSIPEMEEREEIISIHLRLRGHDPAKIADLRHAAEKSEGYVPAELEAAVKDALIDAFSEGTQVTGAMIAKQLENMRPLSIAFADDFRRMQEWADNNARAASSQRKAKVQPRIRARPAAAIDGTARKVNLGDE